MNSTQTEVQWGVFLRRAPYAGFGAPGTMRTIESDSEAEAHRWAAQWGGRVVKRTVVTVRSPWVEPYVPCTRCGWTYDADTLAAYERGEVKLDLNPTHACDRSG